MGLRTIHLQRVYEKDSPEVELLIKDAEVNGERLISGLGVQEYHAESRMNDWYSMLQNMYVSNIDNQDKADCFGISVDGELVGFVTLRYNIPEYRLSVGGNIALWVRKSFRGKGLMKYLYPLVVEKYKDIAPNMTSFLYTASVDNVASINTALSWGGVEAQRAVTYNREEVRRVSRRFWVPIK